MIKSTIKISAALSLIGSTLIGATLATTFKVLALPTEQILQKLSPVPVFTVADEKGAPLVASGEDNAKVAGVFISQQDAENFISKLQTQNPELGKKVKVVPVSLGEVFKLGQGDQKDKNGLNFAYVPKQSEVQAAQTIASQGNQKYKGGVPLFVAKGGKENGYLTVQKDSQQLIPLFFEKKQLEDMVTNFKKQKPDLASTVKIEVISLEGVIQTLKSSNDEMLGKILLVPSKESLEFLRENAPTQGGQTQTTPTQPNK